MIFTSKMPVVIPKGLLRNTFLAFFLQIATLYRNCTNLLCFQICPKNNIERTVIKMSLKSFDKFCESLILNDPKSRKEIFDERQRVVRDRITLESLLIYIAAVFLNTLIMENAYMWCESYYIPMLTLLFICYIYWTIRNAAMGTLFAVNGTFSNKLTGFYCILLGFLFAVSSAFDFEKGKGFINDGRVSKSLILLITFLLILVLGIVMLVLAKKDDKRRLAMENETAADIPGDSDK